MNEILNKFRAVFIGTSQYNGNEVATIFIAYKLGREKHIYDTMFMCSNLPKKEYKQYDQIPLKDLAIKCQENGHPLTIEFVGGAK